MCERRDGSEVPRDDPCFLRRRGGSRMRDCALTWSRSSAIRLRAHLHHAPADRGLTDQCRWGNGGLSIEANTMTGYRVKDRRARFEPEPAPRRPLARRVRAAGRRAGACSVAARAGWLVRHNQYRWLRRDHAEAAAGCSAAGSLRGAQVKVHGCLVQKEGSPPPNCARFRTT